ncbi:hypothetical protein DSM104443_02905 [Usitatibacter rugosus]|uniref:DUF3300 domain-containing protein n=1 Tax=Usitatibacter rugosus TaxID=2732067 RepID=A0A6M4GXT0_9PROT|nr:DUF3300 domain-containing protein [Usitatibacter rugosus]QJR11822.1 hypothetical protein DSM104443_02905 [Usitatibacter rugosus]
MKSIAKVLTGAVAITAASAFAQAPEFPQQPSYSENAYQQAAYQDRGPAIPQQELDSILAPIALYPDALLSQLLMAATFPQDVAQAAQWSRSNTGVKGDAAVRAVDNEPWAPAVKSMVAFPEVLKAMGDQPEWTRKLGEAFLASESNVMQTVQNLRQRADQAGNLRSSEQLAVNRDGDNYALASPSPETTYVPYYDPRTAYGTWMYPDYQPVYWNPWPGYAYAGGWGWGPGIYLSTGFFYGGFNWRYRSVYYSGHRPYYWRGNDYYRGWRNDRHDGRRWNTNGNGNGWNGRDRNPGNGNGNGNWNGRGDGNNGNGNWSGRGNGNNGNGQGRGNDSWRPPQRQEGWQNAQRPVRVEEGTRTSNGSVRSAAPRYGLEGGGRVVRPAQVQAAQPGRAVQGESIGAVRTAPAQVQGAQVQRVPTVRNYTPRQQAPNAGVPQSASVAKPMQMHSAPAPAAQAAQRSFQPQQHSGGGQRSGGGERSGGDRGGGNRGGGEGGGRGRER